MQLNLAKTIPYIFLRMEVFDIDIVRKKNLIFEIAFENFELILYKKIVFKKKKKFVVYL